jgi:hypothetical protein
MGITMNEEHKKMTSLAEHYIEHADQAVTASEIDDPGFKLNLAINTEARVVIFHNKPFRQKMSWLEFDINRNRLDFVMNDGSIRNFGIPVAPDLSKYMQNAFQVLMVLVDEKTGEPEGGHYYPLIIHRT